MNTGRLAQRFGTGRPPANACTVFRKLIRPFAALRHLDLMNSNGQAMMDDRDRDNGSRWDWFHTGDLRWSSGFLANSVCRLQPWVWNSPENCLGWVRKPPDISVIIGPQCLHCLHNWTSVVREVSPIDRQNSSLDRRIRSSSVYEGRGRIIPRFLNSCPQPILIYKLILRTTHRTMENFEYSLFLNSCPQPILISKLKLRTAHRTLSNSRVLE